MCLLFGPMISFIVSGLKKIPLVKRWPKSATFFISSLVGAWTATHGSPTGIDYAAIVQCVLTQFSLAVATHESVTNQVQKVVGGPDLRDVPR
jgi:hypothetical protein